MTTIHLHLKSGAVVTITTKAKPVDVNRRLREERTGDVTRDKSTVIWREA